MTLVKFTRLSPVNAAYAKYESVGLDYDFVGGDENFLFNKLSIGSFL